MNDCFKHLFLYTKGWYKQTDIVEDIYRIYEYVYRPYPINMFYTKKVKVVYEMVIRCFFEYSMYKSNSTIIREIFQKSLPLYQDPFGANLEKELSKKEIMISFIRKICSVLSSEIILDENNKVICDIGEPNYEILPKSQNTIEKEVNK